MPTFETECSVCRRVKYPTLPYRPASYVCVLCQAVEPSKRAARVEAAEKRANTRQNQPGDSTGATG